jgi:N-acetylneuraminic acid mutarotase
VKARVVFLVFLITLSLCVVNAQPVRAFENSWTSKTPMHDARDNLGVAVVKGKIYAIGGWSNRGVMDTNEEYDPISDTWAFKEPMPTARRSFGISVYQNRIYCIGGYGWTYPNQEPYTGVNEVYDPSINTWENKTPMPKSMDILSANVVNGKIYLISGYFDWGPDMQPNVNMAYDPATDSWARKASPPYRILNPLDVVDNKIYYLGYIATNSPESPTEGIVQVYDPESDSWTVRKPAPDHVFGAVGATSGGYAPVRIYLFDQNTPTTHVYDPVTDTWESVGAAMPTDRWHASAAVIDDTFYVIGGSVTQQTVPIWTTTYYGTNEKYIPFLFGTIPTVTIVSPKNGTYTYSDIPLNFTVSDVTSWTGYSLDDQANVTITGNANLTGLSEGTHSLTLYTKNYAADLISSATAYFTVDTSSPSIIVLSPENKTYFRTDIPLNFAVNEPTSWIHYSLDTQEIVATEGNTTLIGLSIGSHNLTVYAKDTAGNIGTSETINFTIAQQSELFPATWIAATAAMIILAGAVAFLVYFRRIKKTKGKGNQA